MMPCIMFMGVAVPIIAYLVPKEHVFMVALAPIVIAAPFLIVGQLKFMKTPLYLKLKDLQ